MNLFQRAGRSCIRKPVKSILLFLVVGIISLLFMAGMASRQAHIAAKDSTRQAIGAGLLLEGNPENRAQRLNEASEVINRMYEDGQGSYGGVHQEKRVVNGQEMWSTWTDHSFESLRLDDIEKIGKTEGISDYNVTTVPTAVKPEGFERIEDPDRDQSADAQGVALIGNLDMALDSNVLSGNVTIEEGRMTGEEDTDVCVISRELAKKNGLQVGDTLGFHRTDGEEPVCEAKIVGIYQVKEKMSPYMSGDTYRSENVIFTDLHFPEKVEQEDPLFEKAYFQVGNVDDYETVKEAVKAVDIDWSRYDLIDNNGNLETMASNFHDLEKLSNALLLLVMGGSFVILLLIFLFWIRNRSKEIGILMALGITKGNILLQLMCEAFLIGSAAVLLSLFFAPAVSNGAAGYLAGQQAEQADLSRQAEAGAVSTDYQAPELTITKVETSMTPEMVMADAACVGGLIVLSIGIVGILIFRKNPRDILDQK